MAAPRCVSLEDSSSRVESGAAVHILTRRPRRAAPRPPSRRQRPEPSPLNYAPSRRAGPSRRRDHRYTSRRRHLRVGLWTEPHSPTSTIASARVIPAHSTVRKDRSPAGARDRSSVSTPLSAATRHCRSGRTSICHDTINRFFPGGSSARQGRVIECVTCRNHCTLRISRRVDAVRSARPEPRPSELRAIRRHF